MENDKNLNEMNVLKFLEAVNKYRGWYMFPFGIR